MQKFSWEGDTPSPDPIPSIFAPTALKLNVTPPEKILVTALRRAQRDVFYSISLVAREWLNQYATSFPVTAAERNEYSMWTGSAGSVPDDKQSDYVTDSMATY